MSNIADMIEAYILQRLALEQSGQVEIRRTDIAEEISCAPSQISYVLSTRFTPQKGFAVESRRGLGGFIRIAQVPMREIIYEEMLEKLEDDPEYETVQSMVRYLLQHQMISKREAALVMASAAAAYEAMDAEDRVHLLKSLFLTLEHYGEEG
ncbi:MAG: CtsR family transcriptional regulator [Selenomonadaceae bacterium]|nr:CtsR family transcriptional regulator [Selenomonadaceae bacterium]